MSRMISLVSFIASQVEARWNCSNGKNPVWFETHSDRLEYIAKNLLPSGSGIDNGTKIDLSTSSPKKLVLDAGFHHMNDGGFYDGWTEHTLIITPTFGGVEIRITGRDRNDIKDYLHEVFHVCLLEMKTQEDWYKQVDPNRT